MNKRLLIVSLAVILLLFLINVSAETVKIQGFVNDYAGILNPEYKSQIESILTKIYDDKLAQISVVTINSTEGTPIEDYSLELAQGHLGDERVNNGMLLLISVQDREYRFEVGRGLEPVFNDAKIGRIGRQYLVENFKAGDYGKGIYESVLAIDNTLRDNKDSLYYVAEPKTNWWPVIIFFGFFGALILFSIIYSYTHGGSFPPSNRGFGGNQNYSNNRTIRSSPSRSFGRGGFGGGGAGGKW